MKAPGDAFRRAVAIDGITAVVGAPNKTVFEVLFAGAAYPEFRRYGWPIQD